jgi:CDP-glucose 4,6-dehydratase
MNQFWRDRPVLVTGGSGLLGGHLVASLLEHGAAVHCLIRDWTPHSILLAEYERNATLIRGDITDQAVMERALGENEIDTVFHLAAQTLVPVANRNPVSTFESNIKGTWTVLEAARRSPLVRQIVAASSDKAYGDQQELPYNESLPLAGKHPYDVSKSCADLICQAYAASYDLPVAVTRCGNLYGAGDLNWNRIIPGTIRSVLRDQQPVIRSDGSLVRDYFYAGDAAEAYMVLAEKLAGDRSLIGSAFNFSSDRPLSVKDITMLVLELMGSHLEPVVLNQATNEIRDQYLDSQLARERLNWSPRRDIRESLLETIDWYRNFLKQPDARPRPMRVAS